MHLPISFWRETLAKLGFRAWRNPKRSTYRRTRRLALESLETRQLLSTVTVALGQNAAEGSQTGYVTFTRDTTVGSLMVNYAIDQSASTAAYGSDYSSPATSGSVTFSAGSSSVNLSVVPIDDSLVESSESVVVRIQSSSGSSGSYTIGSPSSATVLITDNDVGATVNLAATQDAAEGGQTGIFTFTRDVTSGSLTVYWSMTGGTATLGSDYSSPSATSGSVTFSAGEASVTLPGGIVAVDDALVEGSESVVLRLQSGTGSGGSYAVGSASSASVSITDNDATATINVSATQNAAEPSQSGYFTFTRDVTSGSLTVYYSIDQTASTATHGSDYTGPATSGSVTFSAGSASVTLDVIPEDDYSVEGTESVALRLQAGTQSGGSYALGQSSSATVLISDDDVPATINLSATDGAEPSQSGYFTFTRDITAGSLAVYYSLDQTASTASYGSDYTGPSMSGSVTFAHGAASVTLDVVPVDDTLVETDETVVLQLQLGSASGSYTLGSASSATVLIVDDEPPAVTQLKLLNDTGTSPYDKITTDPTLTGQISSMGNSTDVSVQFDYDGDETVDASATVTNREFTHEPAGLSYGLHTIYARSKKWDAGQSEYVYGQWTSLGFTLVDSVNHAPVVSSFTLLHGSGEPGSLTATDPTVTGTLTNDGAVSALRVEFDLDNNGTVGQSTYTDSSGNFTYTPHGLQPGAKTVKARAVEWDDQTASQLFGDWVTLSYTLLEDLGPTVNNLHLVCDTGESGTDLVTSDPRVTGRVTVSSGIVFGLTVQIDTNEDETADGTAITNSVGDFTFSPQNLDLGEVTIQARALSTDSLGGTVYGEWATLAFTLVEGTTGATITNLHLVNDTGESSTDNITSDPTLAGGISFPEGYEAARTSVQFDYNTDDQDGVNGSTLSDIDGAFRYTPMGLTAGQATIRARAALWDVGSSSYCYGPWASITITYQPESQSGGTSEAIGTTPEEAIERAVLAGMNELDEAVLGSNPTAGVFDALQIGTFVPLAGQAGGFVAKLDSTTVPVTQSYSTNVLVDTTVYTDYGQYTIEYTVVPSYSMQVTGDSNSGSFVLVVSIDGSPDYSEVAEVTGREWSMPGSGSYSLSFSSSGTYSVSGGIVTYVGSYTSVESGSFDPVTDESGSQTLSSATSSWSWHDAAHSGFSRSEGGSFSGSGTSGSYSFTDSGSNTYTWDESDASPAGYSTTYTNTSGTSTYTEDEGGTSSYTYTELGSFSPSGTTGTYSDLRNDSYTYSQSWLDDHDYDYVDSFMTASSSYHYASSTRGTPSASYSESGSFGSSGKSGTYSYDWTNNDYSTTTMRTCWREAGTSRATTTPRPAARAAAPRIMRSRGPSRRPRPRGPTPPRTAAATPTTTAIGGAKATPTAIPARVRRTITTTATATAAPAPAITAIRRAAVSPARCPAAASASPTPPAPIAARTTPAASPVTPTRPARPTPTTRASGPARPATTPATRSRAAPLGTGPTRARSISTAAPAPTTPATAARPPSATATRALRTGSTPTPAGAAPRPTTTTTTARAATPTTTARSPPTRRPASRACTRSPRTPTPTTITRAPAAAATATATPTRPRRGATRGTRSATAPTTTPTARGGW